MLTFKHLGKKGNLGNQLFQIASTIALAKKHGHEFAFPEWQYSGYMKKALPTVEVTPNASAVFVPLKEKEYNFHEWEIPSEGFYDLDGWLQTAKYFEPYKKEVLPYVTPKHIPKLPKNAIGISIRRGDFVGNSNYFQLDINFYISALFQYFPDWKTRQIYLFSDDVNYLAHHFGHLSNCTIVTGSPIEQLSYGCALDNFIISNSTFSYWLAYLSNAKTVIRPMHNLDPRGRLAETHDEKDYFIKAWTPHETGKLYAKDVTFTIPLKFDHRDRRLNADLSICLLQRSFETNIIVGETGGKAFNYLAQYCKYMDFNGLGSTFHRTKMLNDMAIEAETPIIVNWDCDNVLPPLRIWSAIDAIRSGSAQMVYPFDGNVYHVPRLPNFNKLEKFLDTGIFGLETFRGKNGMPVETSTGHAIFFDKEAFILGGMENEKMISYGPEDHERYERFNALGISVARIAGPMYHIEHWRGPDSTARNPLFKANHAILDKQRLMNPEQLRAEVDSWEWVNRYTEAYYGRILPGAIESAIHTAQALNAIGINPKNVIDVGCGCGEWSKGFQLAEYIGIDNKVLKRALLIDPGHYLNIDLNELPIFSAPLLIEDIYFDLALCLEVAEHLRPEAGLNLVAELCKLSDKILFGAAIPFQGGNGHINEQWQTYWAKLFAEHGFAPAKKQPDIRNNDSIEVWYKQNIVLYERGGKGSIVDYVHPQMWLNHFAK